MSDRLKWTRGEGPRHFVAMTSSGTVELWYHDEGAQLDRGWRFRMTSGATTETIRVREGDQQVAADEANRLWPNVVRKEQSRVAKLEARQKLEQQIEEACSSGKVDVMAFGLGSATYDRLIEINTILQQQHWLEGTMKPLAMAVSEELFRRRTAPR